MDLYQGSFSRKLAKWAIGNMRVMDAGTQKMRPVMERSIDDVMEILRANDVEIPDQYTYDAWYLFHMAIADYPKTLTTDKQRALFVEETINDPDGNNGNVLACFVAKMCNAGIPVQWERYL